MNRTTSQRTDPIFAAIAAAKRLKKLWFRIYQRLDLADHRAENKHGVRPLGTLIAWRNYSAIGRMEIDAAYGRFLREKVAPRKTIEKEYLAAKARERDDCARAQKAWDKRAGLSALRREYDKALADETRAQRRMVKTRPTTPAGAAAFLAYVNADMMGEADWHRPAIETLIATLNVWGKTAPQAVQS